MARVVVPRRRHRLRRRNVWRVAREARVDGDLDAMPVVHADPKHVVRVRHLLGLRVEVTVDRFSDNFELDLARGGGREGTRRGGGAEVSHARRRPRGGGGGEEKTRERARENERENEKEARERERTRENEREREREHWDGTKCERARWERARAGGERAFNARATQRRGPAPTHRLAALQHRTLRIVPNKRIVQTRIDL